MPLKDPDARRDYQKEYMRNYRAKKKFADEESAENDLDNDATSKPEKTYTPEPQIATQPTAPPQPTATGDMPAELLEVLRGTTKAAAKDGDGFMKFLDRAIETAPTWLPLVQKFSAGFMQNMQAAQPEQHQQATMILPSAPAGYGTLQALKHENNGAWVRQRDAYLAGVPVPANSGIQGTPVDAAGRSLVPPNAKMAMHAQQEQYFQAAQGLPAGQSTGGATMTQAELQRDIAATNAAFPVDRPTNEPKLVERTDGQPATINEAVAQREAAAKATQEEQPSEENVMEILKADNEKLANNLIEKINDASDKDIAAHLTDTKSLVKKFKGLHALGLIGAQYRELIASITPEQITELLKERCAEKWKTHMEGNADRAEQLAALWVELQGIVEEE